MGFQVASWLALFGAAQTADIITTAAGRARGAIEAMPISGSLLNEGGLALLITVKLALVVAIGAALVLAWHWARQQRPRARLVFRLVLTGTQVVTVVLAVISLQNAILLGTLG
jgi:hypothetical protein